MFDIWSSLSALEQPCLYRPIADRQLDTDGLVKRGILASLDRLFCEQLASGQASFEMPPRPPAIPVEHRFINVSALQKSIRRGDAEGAMRFALQGCALNAEQVFRRLAVCAVEDVGLGNMLAAGMAVAVMGNRKMREGTSAGELAAYIASVLAISPKSRLACDLLSIADYDRSLNPLKRRFAERSEAELSANALSRDRSMQERMVSSWLLAGSARYRGMTMPQVARSRSAFMLLLVARRVPLIFYYLADRTGARLADAMFVSLLLVAEMIARDPTIGICMGAASKAVTIGGYPAAAIDLHTSEGRRALARFGRECPTIANICRSLSASMRDIAVRHGVFIAEDGRLEQQLRFDAANRVEKRAHDVELRFAGLHGPLQQSHLVSAIRDNLPALNDLRQAELTLGAKRM